MITLGDGARRMDEGNASANNSKVKLSVFFNNGSDAKLRNLATDRRITHITGGQDTCPCT